MGAGNSEGGVVMAYVAKRISDGDWGVCEGDSELAVLRTLRGEIHGEQWAKRAADALNGVGQAGPSVDEMAARFATADVGTMDLYPEDGLRQRIAKEAYAMADAMMAEQQRRAKGEG